MSAAAYAGASNGAMAISRAREPKAVVLAGLARWVVGVLLLYAVGAKLIHIDAGSGRVIAGVDAFARLIAAHRVIPTEWAHAAGGAALLAEVVVGVWLLAHARVRAAAWSAMTLLTIFSIYLIAARLRSGDPNCGCFGRVTGASLAWGLARNAALILGASATLWTSAGRSRDRRSRIGSCRWA